MGFAPDRPVSLGVPEHDGDWPQPPELKFLSPRDDRARFTLIRGEGMGKTEVKHLPQRRDKKVPATLNTTIDQRVLTMLNAFVDWLNLEKADVCQLALENLMNEDAYKEFRDGFKTGAITAPAPPKVSGKSGKGKATAASA